MDYFEQIMQEARNQRVAETGQLTLGMLIQQLRDIEDAEKEVFFDFGHDRRYPVGFISWRGIYRELALTYEDHNNYGPMSVGEFLSLCEKTVGEEFYGYKGGEFIMDESTPIWVDNYGEANSIALRHVDERDQVVLVTGYCEPYDL